jgi:hypothetical protein
MKLSKLAVGYSLIFIVLTSFAVLAIQSAPTLTIKGFIVPKKVKLDKPAPSKFYVFVWFRGRSGPSVGDIDPSTLLIEGVVAPLPGSAHHFWFLFCFAVDGTELVDMIWMKVYHMGIPPGKQRKVPLTITGQLYDGTPFEGTLTVKVYHPNPGPPPPP